MAKYSGFSTILALVLILVLLLVFHADLGLHIYVAWLLSLGLTTLVFYWADKRLAGIRRLSVRVPEHMLNLLTLAGGFIGAWLGRGLLRHKTSIRKHRDMFAILIVSTLLHAGLIYWVFFQGR